MDQYIIAIFGTVAIWLTQQKGHPEWAKYACLCGMVSQPCFLYSTYTNSQWGMLLTAIVCTGIWIQGLYNFWLAPSVRNNHSVSGSAPNIA